MNMPLMFPKSDAVSAITAALAADGFLDMDPREITADDYTVNANNDMHNWDNAIGTPPATQTGSDGNKPNYLSSYAPFGGLPAVNFVASSSAWMTFGDAYDAHLSGTDVILSIYAIVKLDSATGFDLLLGKNGSSIKQMYLGFNNGLPLIYTAPATSGAGAREITNDAGLNDSDPYLVEWHIDGTIDTGDGLDRVDIAINGVFGTPTITLGGSSGISNGGIANSSNELGLSSFNGQAYLIGLDGRLGRLLGFNRTGKGAYSAADKTAIREELADEWGITL